MLFICTHGVVQKCQLTRSYSCVFCASVIITMAVSRVEQEGDDSCFHTLSCDVQVSTFVKAHRAPKNQVLSLVH